jgi:hypothetical protein
MNKTVLAVHAHPDGGRRPRGPTTGAIGRRPRRPLSAAATAGGRMGCARGGWAATSPGWRCAARTPVPQLRRAERSASTVCRVSVGCQGVEARTVANAGPPKSTPCGSMWYVRYREGLTHRSRRSRL